MVMFVFYDISYIFDVFYDIVIFLMFFMVLVIFLTISLNILFITIWVNFLDQNRQVKSEIFHKLGLHLID